MEVQLWSTPGKARHFIISDAVPRRPGSLALRSLAGDNLEVDPEWAQRFEVSEAEARAWAQAEFGFMLDHLRYRIDARLARARAALDAAKRTPVASDSPVTPDAVPAVMALPRAVLGSLSGDASRVEKANGELAEVEARLGAAGIDLGGRLGAFPSRLARLRQDSAGPRFRSGCNSGYGRYVNCGTGARSIVRRPLDRLLAQVVGPLHSTALAS